MQNAAVLNQHFKKIEQNPSVSEGTVEESFQETDTFNSRKTILGNGRTTASLKRIATINKSYHQTFF